MNPKSIALFYGHVSSNIGDVAINRGTINLLRTAFPAADISVVLLGVEDSPHLQSAMRSFGADGSLRFIHLEGTEQQALDYSTEPARLLTDSGCAGADLVVMAAGEHLFSYERNPNNRNLFWRTLPAFAARAAGKHSLILPSTFGPYESAEARELLAQLVAAQPRFGIRDLRSAAQLTTVVPECRPEVGLDPAFFLQPAESRRNDPAGRIGIVMRSEGWGLRVAKEERDRFDKAVKKSGYQESLAYRFTLALVKKILVESDRQVRLFVQLEADRAIAEAVAAALADTEAAARLEIVTPTSIDDYLSMLAEVDCVVASRFHALVLGMVSGKPGFGLYFDAHGHKIPGLFDLLESPDEPLNLSKTQPEDAAETVFAWCVGGAPNFAPVGQRISALRETTITWIKSVPDVEPAPELPLSAVHALAAQAFSMTDRGHEAETRKFRTRANQYKRELDAAKAERATLLGAQKAERKRLERDIERLSGANASLTEAAKRDARRIGTLAEEKQALESERDTLVGQAEKSARRIGMLAEQKQALATERDTLIGQAEESARRIGTLAEQKQALEAERETLVRQAEDDAGRIEALVHQKDALEKTRDRLAMEAERDARRVSALTREGLQLKEQQAKSMIEARNSAQRIMALEAQLDRIENSISFRLGAALVQGAKSRRNFLRLPREVRSLYAEHRRRGKQPPGISAAARAAPVTAGAGPEAMPKADELVSLFRRQGVAGVVKQAEAQHPSDKAARRNAIIAASKTLAAEGVPEAEFELVRRAVAIDESDASLRALHWAAQRKGDYMTAWRCVRRIERLYGAKPTPAQAAFLEKLHRSPAYQLSLLDKVPSNPQYVPAPVSNRICYVLHNSLPFSSGGYATRAQGLALGLEKSGFEVVAVSRPGYPLDIKPDLDPNSVPLEETVEGIAYRRVLAPLRSGHSALDYMSAAADALTVRLAEIRPTAVVAASNHLTGLPALIAARRLGLPFFYEVRGFWEITRISREPEFEESAAFKVQLLLESELAKRADHVFTLTGPMERELVRRGVAPETITILPNSCEPERFTPRERDAALAARLGIPASVPVIGYVGTFVQYEGLELLVAAAADLRDRGHDFRLLLVGNENASGQDVGPITAEIRRIAEERGLGDRLIMPGRVPHEEVEAYYSLIDIAPFPRKAQPVTELVSPMKPLEAYAMEKAVVVSSVGALLEMVEDGRTGLVFEKDNIASLTDVLARLIADPELRARLGREGRRWVEAERTWNATAERATATIRRIVERQQSAAPAMAAAGAR